MADGVLDFLFNGQPPPAATSTAVSQQGFPDWYQEYLRGLASKSSAIAATPYTAYQGPRVAPMTDLQNQAAGLTQSSVGQFQPALRGALSTLSNITDNSNVDSLNSSIARLGTRNLTENLLPALNNTFIGAGQFGSSRMEDFYGRAVRDTNEAITNAQAQALLQNQQQQISAASGLGNLGQLGQTMNLRDAAALDTAGQEQQNQTQQNINAGINQFNEERQYPYDQASFLNSIIRGLQVPSMTSTTQTQPFSGQLQPSGLSQLAGSALTASALQSLFKKRGGLVHLEKGGFPRRVPTTTTAPSRLGKALLPKYKRGALGMLRSPSVR